MFTTKKCRHQTKMISPNQSEIYIWKPKVVRTTKLGSKTSIECTNMDKYFLQ